MEKSRPIVITELSDEVTGKNEEADRLVVWHTLVLDVHPAGQDPIRIPLIYFEKVEDGKQYADFVTRIVRSGVPRSLRPVVRQALLAHLGRRFDISQKAWPPEPTRFGPGDVILSIHGNAWQFAPADAIRFLEACTRYESTGRDRDQPLASDHGGVLIEGVPVVSLDYDDDWSAENLQELISRIDSRRAT